MSVYVWVCVWRARGDLGCYLTHLFEIWSLIDLAVTSHKRLWAPSILSLTSQDCGYKSVPLHLAVFLPRCWGLNLDPHEFNESILLTVRSPRFLFFLRAVVISLLPVRNNQFMNSLHCVSGICLSYTCTCGVCGCTCLCVHVCTNVRCLSRSLSSLNLRQGLFLSLAINGWLDWLTSKLCGSSCLSP